MQRHIYAIVLGVEINYNDLALLLVRQEATLITDIAINFSCQLKQ